VTGAGLAFRLARSHGARPHPAGCDLLAGRLRRVVGGLSACDPAVSPWYGGSRSLLRRTTETAVPTRRRSVPEIRITPVPSTRHGRRERRRGWWRSRCSR